MRISLESCEKFVIGDTDVGWVGTECEGNLVLISPIFYDLVELYGFWVRSAEAISKDLSRRKAPDCEEITRSLHASGRHELFHAAADNCFSQKGGRLIMMIGGIGYKPAYYPVEQLNLFDLLQSICGPGRNGLSEGDWKDLDRCLVNLGYGGINDPGARNMIDQAFKSAREAVNKRVKGLLKKYPDLALFL